MTEKSKPWEIIVAGSILAILIWFLTWLLVPWHYDLSKNSELVGKSFKTEIDLYIYKYGDSGNIHLEIPGMNTADLEVAENKPMPFQDGNDKILKIVPKGAVFTIGRVEKVVKRLGFRSDIWIKAKFKDPAIYHKEIDVTFLTDMFKDSQSMENEYIRELSTDSIAHNGGGNGK